MATRMQLAPNTTYRVINWDTNVIIQTFDNASAAKRFCRDQGYIENRLAGNMPVAFVQADCINPTTNEVHTDCCYYNPRF